MEVIAKKSKDAHSINVFLISVGVVAIFADTIFLGWYIANVVLPANDLIMMLTIGFWVFVIFAVGLVLLFLGSKAAKKTADLPEVLISYDNGQLRFADGYCCRPVDIVDVEYEATKLADPHGKRLNFGTLTVYTKDKKIIYEQVDRVREAHSKLISLMRDGLGSRVD